jgi:hypothetical protein
MTSVRTLADEVDSLSPFAGKAREMHRAVARMATAGGLVTISIPELAQAACTTARSASRWVWEAAEPEGWLELVVDRRKLHRPSTFRVVDPRKLIGG